MHCAAKPSLRHPVLNGGLLLRGLSLPRPGSVSLSISRLAIATGCAIVGLQAHADLLKDSQATLSMRNFYFNNDNRDGSADPSKTEEWAQGFMLNYRSGFTEGPVGLGVDATGMLGLTLDSGRGRHVGSTMIPSDGDRAADQWSRFGATAKLKASKTELRYGQLIPKIPVLVATDGRLLPQTYQGVQVQSKELDDFTFLAGGLNRATGRGSTNRTGMAVAGGSQQSDRFYFAGSITGLTATCCCNTTQASSKTITPSIFWASITNGRWATTAR